MPCSFFVFCLTVVNCANIYHFYYHLHTYWWKTNAPKKLMLSIINTASTRHRWWRQLQASSRIAIWFRIAYASDKVLISGMNTLFCVTKFLISCPVDHPNEWSIDWYCKLIVCLIWQRPGGYRLRWNVPGSSEKWIRESPWWERAWLKSRAWAWCGLHVCFGGNCRHTNTTW